MQCSAITRWLATTIAFCLVGPITADEAAVRSAISDYVTAFNARDLAAIEGMWATDAVYVDHALGERTEGRVAIMGDIATAFENTQPLLLSGSVDSVKLVLENVANASGTVSLTDGNGEVSTTKFTALLVAKDGQWMMHSLEEIAIQLPTSPGAALAELDWLVGDWIDATGESTVRAKVRSAIGGAFLVRSFESEEADGRLAQSTQVIGYDPRAMQIRSWTFNADGSFGDGVWSKLDGDWLIKSTQTLADGSAASGTYVMKPESDDAFTVQLIGREIEGEPQPASAVVSVNRAPEAAAAVSSPASTNQ